MTRALNNLNRPKRGNTNLDGTTRGDTRELLQTPSNRERHDGSIRLALGDRPDGATSVSVGDSG